MADELREPLIVLRRVSKEYASGEELVRALRDVDLTLEAGEFVAIIGTSGSGKSTLMNMLGCLDRPTHGTYSLAGIDAGGRSNDARALVRNRLIGFIFQGFNLLPRTTALENVELPLQYRGIGGKERRRRASAALEAVGLSDRMHHTPNQLSGGQQQRVAIARALVTDPPLLLADEPTGNLDTRTSLEVLALLQRLNRDRGITIVLVTHEADIAACASRVITVRDGRIVSDQRTTEPLDAARALAAMPPPEVHRAPAEGRGDDEAIERARRLGPPLPSSVYTASFAALLAGALVGVAYGRFVLGNVLWAPPIVFAFLFEAFVAARFGRRAVGRELTSDQRARFAITSTAVTLGLCGLGVLVASYVGPGPWLKQLVVRGLPVLMGMALACAGALALLRYLLVTLLSSSR